MSNRKHRLRACEIKGLQWKHVDFALGRIQIRRSKTPAGWRDPSLNNRCMMALKQLSSKAQELGFDDAEQFVFPWHGRDKQIDPIRPMTSWRSAWRSIRKAAGLPSVRFHDGRHTALTRLAEAGQPDLVIQAQLGHVSPAMMKTYSHIRRKALDAAAEALEPHATEGPTPWIQGPTAAPVTSHGTSHKGAVKARVLEFPSVLPET
jgi:integrase